MKPFWQSKTLWVNALALGVHIANQYLGLTSVPDPNPTLLILANIALRLITKQPISVS